MADTRAEVRNAADAQQVGNAARREKDKAARAKQALLEVMETPAGRIVLWDLLERAGVFKSIWHPSAQIHYNAGRQDFGHEMMAMFAEASDDNFELMQREARIFAKRKALERDAVNNKSTASQETDK